MMKRFLVPLVMIPVLTLAMAGCVSQPAAPEELQAFRPVQAVLERNCVHCHGEQRLATMPPISDSHALARLVGPKNFIVPRQPQSSRFYKVVSIPDTVPGVMPPTGHAIRKAEVAVLRDWIAAGAKVPQGPAIEFQPQGELPRSR
jgi:hypothetical protein